MNRHIRSAVVWSFLLLTLVAVSAPALAQPLPNPWPWSFVSNLDVRCYKIDRPIQLWLDHLNPLFIQKNLPREFVDLDPQQLCVPVYKNGKVPPDDALPFLRWVDWRCYGINGPPLNLPLRLTHLNPAISAWTPFNDVTVREPQQLCVPVLKANPTGTSPTPPPEVRRLVQYLDVKCYRVDPGVSPYWPLQLTHLNPLLASTPPVQEPVTFGDPFQLCVPVAKATPTGSPDYPPSDLRPIIDNSDVLCYRLRGQRLNRLLTLTHLNPLLTGLPAETVWVSDSQKLCVPVSKSDPPPPPPTGGQ